MVGGGHHEPSVFTHFLPGMVSGIVLGGITSALLITYIASTSLQFFWEASRVKAYGPTETCADASSVRIASVASENGGTLTSIIVGDGEETLLTVPREHFRFVLVGSERYAYLSAAASADQQEAFPAVSLYKIDYCENKTITHVLGSTGDPANIVGMSATGTWILYKKDVLLLMNTSTHAVTALAANGEVTDVVFSQADDGGALRFTDGSGVVWRAVEGEGDIQEDAFTTVEAKLTAWTLLSPEEYLANIK